MNGGSISGDWQCCITCSAGDGLLAGPGLFPPLLEPELDSLERLGPHDLAPGVDAELDPPPAIELRTV